jgi:hypothetical protein
MSGDDIAELMNSKYSCRVAYTGYQEWDNTERFFYKTKRSKRIIAVVKLSSLSFIDEIEQVARKIDNTGKKEAISKITDLLVSGETKFDIWATGAGKDCYRFGSDVAELAEHLDIKSQEFDFLGRKGNKEWRAIISLGMVFGCNGVKRVYGYVKRYVPTSYR